MIHFGGSSAKKSGLLDKVIRALDEEKIAHVEFGGVQPNPELSLVREGIALCQKENVDFIDISCYILQQKIVTTR